MVEKEERIQVQRFAGGWKDLGTWNTLTEAMEEATVGDAVLGGDCRKQSMWSMNWIFPWCAWG